MGNLKTRLVLTDAKNCMRISDGEIKQGCMNVLFELDNGMAIRRCTKFFPVATRGITVLGEVR